MIYVFLAEGFELVEAMAPVDILRRAGLSVALAGVGGREIVSSNGVPVKTDVTAQEAAEAADLEAVVLPGGLPGTLNLEKSQAVQAAIDRCVKEERLVGAICAAPSILAHKGLLKGREATSFPNFQKDLEEGGATLGKGYVCRDGQFITGRGMGVSIQFGLKLVEALVSPEEAARIRTSIQWEA